MPSYKKHLKREKGITITIITPVVASMFSILTSIINNAATNQSSYWMYRSEKGNWWNGIILKYRVSVKTRWSHAKIRAKRKFRPKAVAIIFIFSSHSNIAKDLSTMLVRPSFYNFRVNYIPRNLSPVPRNDWKPVKSVKSFLDITLKKMLKIRPHS